MCAFSKVLNSTPSDVLNTTQNMDRCVSVMRGDNTHSFRKFVSLVRKSNCDSEEFQVISSFYTHTESQISALKSGLSQNSPCSYHDIVILKKVSCDVVHKVPVDLWDLKYQVTCHNAFELFSKTDLVSLKTILIAMENFPLEAYLLLYPFIGSILGISVFSCCFTYLSEGKFLETLFKKTILRVTDGPLNFRDITYYRPSKAALIISGVVSSSAIYAVMQYQKLSETESKVDIPLDILKPYRFTGNTAVAIRIFKDNTGAVLYSGLKIWSTYKKIFVLSMLEPVWNLGKKLLVSSTT